MTDDMNMMEAALNEEALDHLEILVRKSVLLAFLLSHEDHLLQRTSLGPTDTAAIIPQNARLVL